MQEEVPVSEEKIAKNWAKVEARLKVTKELRGLEPDEKINPTKTKGIITYLSLAAGIVLFLLAGWRVNQYTHQTTGPGEQLTMALPDGSRVAMNASSEIRYKPYLWWLNRKVALDGEAFFEIVEGSKFDVTSKRGKFVSVLGTSFNIYDRADDYVVNCVSGRVAVQAESRRVALQAGEFIAFGKKVVTPQVSTGDTTLVGSWRKGLFMFEAKPLQSVFEEFERQFNMDVTYTPEHGALIYDGFFKDDDPIRALKLICEPMGLNFTVKEGVVHINP